jgi:hypothetical protein
MLDLPQHSRQILEDRFRAFASIFDDELCRGNRVRKISLAGKRVCR